MVLFTGLPLAVVIHEERHRLRKQRRPYAVRLPKLKIPDK